MGDPAVIAAGRSLAATLAAALLASCAGPTAQDRAYIAGFEAAARAVVPFAPVTDSQPRLDLPGAYRLQRQLVARRIAKGDRVAGYKGGLMSQASLKARGVSEPLVGVLFRSDLLDSGSPVSLCGYRKASFEMKLGFLFSRAVTTPPADGAALRESVAGIVPVVDLPDIAYRNPDRYSAVDMVAANVSAFRYVRGTEHEPQDLDLDPLAVSMARDGRPLTSGRGSESFGNQWASLAMVVRQILASGRRIAAGDLVITGKIGERGWLPPGDYRADYGPLGTVSFAVTPCAG